MERWSQAKLICLFPKNQTLMAAAFALVRIIQGKTQIYLVPLLEGQLFQHQIERPRKKNLNQLNVASESFQAINIY